MVNTRDVSHNARAGSACTGKCRTIGRRRPGTSGPASQTAVDHLRVRTGVASTRPRLTLAVAPRGDVFERAARDPCGVYVAWGCAVLASDRSRDWTPLHGYVVCGAVRCVVGADVGGSEDRIGTSFP